MHASSFATASRLQRLWRSLRHRWFPRPQDIPDGLWYQTLLRYPFLTELPLQAQHRLRRLSSGFLSRKEFHGANGLEISDEIALAIAAQACLPLVFMPRGDKALDWYGDFVGIVVHPSEAIARREVTDGAGVVHHYREALLGEAMEGGPVMLSWAHVAQAADTTAQGHNLVIHEFAHKLDMRHKPRGTGADGCPPLPQGFLGLPHGQARRHWRTVLGQAFDRFSEQVALAERFGEARPWLDSYGAHSPAEFFAVACEAYWVSRERFGQEFAELMPLFDGFFRPPN